MPIENVNEKFNEQRPKTQHTRYVENFLKTNLWESLRLVTLND